MPVPHSLLSFVPVIIMQVLSIVYFYAHAMVWFSVPAFTCQPTVPGRGAGVSMPCLWHMFLLGQLLGVCCRCLAHCRRLMLFNGLFEG